VAAGLGSGAAVSVALVRALSAFLGHPLPDEEVSQIAYEVEKLHHGTPSGIDNTVITYIRPVYFVRAIPGGSRTANRIETFPIKQPFTLVIGDTGVSSPTSIAVGDVRQAWQTDPARYERLFDAVGTIAEKARQLMENGQSNLLGALMDENHSLLSEMSVSSPELDRLVEAARSSGASGAKLSGAGRGGNMIALADEEKAEAISQALRSSGATRTIVTTIKSSSP
jgi:mevalonate kinase